MRFTTPPLFAICRVSSTPALAAKCVQLQRVLLRKPRQLWKPVLQDLHQSGILARCNRRGQHGVTTRACHARLVGIVIGTAVRVWWDLRRIVDAKRRRTKSAKSVVCWRGKYIFLCNGIKGKIDGKKERWHTQNCHQACHNSKFNNK